MQTITIGRQSDNDVVINDPTVGRHHLRIMQYDDGHYSVLDLNSTNGTYVNGKRVYGEAYLSPNDDVQIGRTILPWKTYFVSHVRSSRKRTISRILPILLGIIGVVLVVLLLGQSNKDNPRDNGSPKQQSSMSNNQHRGNNLPYRKNISEDLVGQVITAPSEDGYFPKEWSWKIGSGEVLSVEELSRRNDPSGYEVIDILAHLHRGPLKIDAKMVLKYSQNGSQRVLSYIRATELTIPRQSDYSQCVELRMEYDFLPSLMLYNRSNIKLFVGGDYSSGNETCLFGAIVEPHSSVMIAMGSIQGHHVHFAYEN